MFDKKYNDLLSKYLDYEFKDKGEENEYLRACSGI
jgi:hypothetical protein